jgi:hypothetical protein
LLGIDPSSCSMPYLDLNHFEDRTIEFSVLHISELPEWTTGKTRGKGSGDRIVVDSLLGPPYLQEDHKAVNSKGALDLHCRQFCETQCGSTLPSLLYHRNIVGISYIWQKGAQLWFINKF